MAGDPICGLGWTRKTTAKIADELGRLGIEVSARTVARLLAEMGFSLETARKNIASGFTPKPDYRAHRERQFREISRVRRGFVRAGLPVVSIDCKKKELMGRFKNPGSVWCRQPKQVNDHDFRSDASGLAVPYGIYDVRKNRGTVVVGTSRNSDRLQMRGCFCAAPKQLATIMLFVIAAAQTAETAPDGRPSIGA